MKGIAKKTVAFAICVILLVCTLGTALGEAQSYSLIQYLFASTESEDYIGEAYVSNYDQLDYVALIYNYDTLELSLCGLEQLTYWPNVEFNKGIYALGCVCLTYEYLAGLEPDTKLVVGLVGNDEEKNIWIDNAESGTAFVELIASLTESE